MYVQDHSCGEGFTISSPSQPKIANNRRKYCQTTPTPNRRPIGATLPLSETGQRLTALFPNGWDWIYTETPVRDCKPAWETVKQYPLTPIEQWSLHQDPSCIIGIRPGSTTLWGILDIDRDSAYHPAQNPDALATIRHTLEDLGIARILINQSSHSGGLHLYLPLPKSVSSYYLSIALKYHLEAAGIQIRSGQCELFPNPKRYVPQGQGFSLFNGIRLPMQPGTGFLPLDEDLTPLPWTLDDWLDAFDSAAAHQDIERLNQQLEDAKHNRKIRSHRNPHSIDTWRNRIEEEKQQGWTGPGQTNEKLKVFACEARVFLNMDSEQQIADYIERTARQSPGFYEHSNHTQDISQRSREIAHWAMRYYWPLGSAPQRSTEYHSPVPPIADFGYHQAKQEAAQERIKQAIADLEEQGCLPATATERAQAIIERANVSKKTLYRAANKPLWHPDYLPSSDPAKPLEPANPTPDSTAVLETATTPTSVSLQIILFQAIALFLLNQLNEVEATPTPTSEPPPQTSPEQPPTAPAAQDSTLETAAPPSPPIKNWADLRASLPESFQAKIAAAERQRQRDQEREQQRRQHAQFRQSQRSSLPHLTPDPIPPLIPEVIAEPIPLPNQNLLEPKPPLNLAETHTQQESFQLSPKSVQTRLEKTLEPLIKGLSLQLLKYVGFVMLFLLSGAAATLAPQGQKVALAALPEAEIPGRGGLGGDFASHSPPITNWADLKASLPERLQAKITQAERQRDQQQAAQRRQRLLSLELLGTAIPFPDLVPKPSLSARSPLSLPGSPLAPVQQRPPTPAEQEEFETWYALAEAFKLVTDYHWADREYWIESNEQWYPYCELSGIFTPRRLGQYLHLDSEPHPPQPNSI